MKEKDAMGIPWRVAFALRADGWYLRQEIVWSKTFGKPEPSRDRLPNRHEQIFLLSKTKRYYFAKPALPEFARGSVWEVPPVGLSSHGASFSARQIEPCVLAGSPPGGTVLDPFGGSGTTAGVALKHGRKAILCELNPDYAELVEARVRSIAGPAHATPKKLVAPQNDNKPDGMIPLERLLRKVLYG